MYSDITLFYIALSESTLDFTLLFSPIFSFLVRGLASSFSSLFKYIFNKTLSLSYLVVVKLVELD